MANPHLHCCKVISFIWRKAANIKILGCLIWYLIGGGALQRHHLCAQAIKKSVFHHVYLNYHHLRHTKVFGLGGRLGSMECSLFSFGVEESPGISGEWAVPIRLMAQTVSSSIFSLAGARVNELAGATEWRPKNVCPTRYEIIKKKKSTLWLKWCHLPKK